MFCSAGIVYISTQLRVNLTNHRESDTGLRCIYSQAGSNVMRGMAEGMTGAEAGQLLMGTRNKRSGGNAFVNGPKAVVVWSDVK